MKKIFLYILLFSSFLISLNVYANECFDWDCTVTPNNDAELNELEFDDYGSNSPSTDASNVNDESKDEGKDTLNSWCTYKEWVSLSSFLNWCKPKTVVWWWTMTIEGWFKDKINDWIQNIALVLWVWAVWALVYAAILLQLSGWEDEQIKKAKNIVKWTLIWFLLLISASWIIYVVINVMFGLWWS